jgi:hypothetical protein
MAEGGAGTAAVADPASEVALISGPAGGVAATRVDPARPYAPSWLDRLFDWLVSLPGPTWLAYLVLLPVSIILANSALWLSGLLPLGEIDSTQVLWGIASVALLAAAHHLRAVAASAFDSFRPALGEATVDVDRATYELTVIPARPVLALTAFAFAVTPLYWLADPEASDVVGLTGLGFVPRLISEGGTSAIVLAILYQAIRQMRRVNQLHAEAREINLFRPAPLYAFARLTARAGIVVVAFNTAGLGIALSSVSLTETAVRTFAPWLIAFLVGAIVIFVVPLLGMRRRLVAEKGRLEDAAGDRLRALLGELNVAIDARDTARVEGLDRTISALRRETEVLARLPTWPWSLGTIRGFASALVVPVLLFLVQRYLSQLLG